jgi:ATP-binding cassette subfamily F protein 3
VLDEPTNHLDLAAREQLERVLVDFGGTLLFVSHDRYFIDKLATELWLIDDCELRRWEGNWTSYQRARAAGREATVIAYERPTAVEPSRHEPAPERPAQQPQKAAAAPTAPDRGKQGRRASPVRRVSGLRALEARIAAMELQLRQLSDKVAQIAQSGNYLETRRIGEEHAALEQSLRTLYEEWARVSEDEKA